MKIHESKLREALRTIQQGPLTRADAATIIDVARFAASVDGRMDMGEMATVACISKAVYAMSGEAEAPVPSTPVTLDWVREIDKKLTATGSRELAYAAARLVIVANNTVTKEEESLARHLTSTLHIGSARAGELDALIGSVLTS